MIETSAAWTTRTIGPMTATADELGERLTHCILVLLCALIGVTCQQGGIWIAHWCGHCGGYPILPAFLALAALAFSPLAAFSAAVMAGVFLVRGRRFYRGVRARHANSMLVAALAISLHVLVVLDGWRAVMDANVHTEKAMDTILGCTGKTCWWEVFRLF